jgi:hypothetical protein
VCCYSAAVNKTVRWVVTLLLALSLPLQGFAATSMLMCGPSHQVPSQSMPAHHATAQPHAHDMAAANAAHHGAVAAPGDSDDAGNGAETYRKCSQCAACNVTLAPAPPLLVLHEARVADHYEPVQIEPGAGFLTGGIERPPRSILA